MPNETGNAFDIDLEKGVVTLKKGENAKSFNLKDENELTSLIKLGQRGWYYDDEASVELGQLRKVIKNWDSAIDAAKKDDAAMSELVGKLETLIGRPLTRQEERDLNRGEKPKILDDDDENNRLLNHIDELQKEIKQLKQSQSEFKKSNEEQRLAELQKEIDAEATRLEKKYDGKDDAPKFDRKKVFAYASEKGLDDLELAFKLLNFEKLTEYAQKKALNDFKAQQDKRKTGFVETGGEATDFQPPAGKGSKRLTYHQMGRDALKSAKDSGISFFTDD